MQARSYRILRPVPDLVAQIHSPPLAAVRLQLPLLHLHPTQKHLRPCRIPKIASQAAAEGQLKSAQQHADDHSQSHLRAKCQAYYQKGEKELNKGFDTQGRKNLSWRTVLSAKTELLLSRSSYAVLSLMAGNYCIWAWTSQQRMGLTFCMQRRMTAPKEQMNMAPTNSPTYIPGLSSDICESEQMFIQLSVSAQFTVRAIEVKWLWIWIQNILRLSLTSITFAIASSPTSPIHTAKLQFSASEQKVLAPKKQGISSAVPTAISETPKEPSQCCPRQVRAAQTSIGTAEPSQPDSKPAKRVEAVDCDPAKMMEQTD